MPTCLQSGFPGTAWTTTARAPPSEREALWLSVACHPLMATPPSERVPPICCHLCDPRWRKLSIIPRWLRPGFSCSRWTVFSLTASRPAWPSTVSCPLNPRVLAGAGCVFPVPGMPEPPARPPGAIPFSGTAGPAACGEAGMAGSLSGPWSPSVRCQPSLYLHPPRTPRRARRGLRGRRRNAKCRGASLPNVIHWRWRGAPAPSNPRPGRALPWPLHHPRRCRLPLP